MPLLKRTVELRVFKTGRERTSSKELIILNILDKSVMPDGTEIQLEDWSDRNSDKNPSLYGLTIGAYPIAQRTGKFGWKQGGKRFRLTIACNSYMGYLDEEVRSDYDALKIGSKTLQDLFEHFWNRKWDMWCLGMDVEEPSY